MGWLVKHYSAVVATCVTSILFMCLIFWMQVSSGARTMELIKDSVILEQSIKSYEEVTKEQTLYIQGSNKLISGQRENLIKATAVIEMQNQLIQELIKRIKSLTAPQFDPDKWTSNLNESKNTR